ncbi:MAG: hypothetical protein ABEJ65_02820 [bacterium]
MDEPEDLGVEVDAPDTERIKEDPEYRQEILDKMNQRVSRRRTRRHMRFYLFVLLAISLFIAGLFTGSFLEEQLARWVTLMVVSLVIVPLMGFMLILSSKSKQGDTSGGE